MIDSSAPFLIDGQYSYGLNGVSVLASNQTNFGFLSSCRAQSVTIDGGAPVACIISAGGDDLCPFVDSSVSFSPLSDGKHTATVLCTGCIPNQQGNGCTPVGANASVSFITGSTPPQLVVSSAPVIGSTLPFSAIQFGGSNFDVIPPATLYIDANGILSRTVQISTGAWSLVVDTASLGFLSSFGLTVGFSARDDVGNTVVYSTTNAFGLHQTGASFSVDPTLSFSYMIDGTPPATTIEVDTSGVISTIRGFTRDNIEVDSVYLAIQSGGTYWNGTQFASTSPVSIRVPIQPGPAVHWGYNIDLPPGRTFTISAVAYDEVGNVSTTTLAGEIPGAILASYSIPFLPSQSLDTVAFDQNPFFVQYNPNLPTTVCGHVSGNDQNPVYTATSKNGYLAAQITSQAGCDVAIQVTASGNYCQTDDTLQVFNHGQMLGQVDGHILIPRTESGSESPLLPPIYTPLAQDEFGNTTAATNLKRYLITFSGNNNAGAPSMDLTGAKFIELLYTQPFSQNGVRYPYCTTLPKPKTGVFDNPNLLVDTYGLNNFPLQIGPPGAIVCGYHVQQLYVVNNRCIIPQPPKIIDVPFYFTYPGIYPGSLHITRQEADASLGN